MDNVFIYQSAELPDFARMPKGTIGMFFCEWAKLQTAQSRITGTFKRSSLAVKGACSIKSFNATDPDNGKGFKVLMVEVLTPIGARKQRGRPQKLNLTRDQIIAKRVARTTTAPVVTATQSMSAGQGIPQHVIDRMKRGKHPASGGVANDTVEVEAGARQILDKHIDDASNDKTVTFWPVTP